MTHTVELPALDGRDILGFLAALGVVRLLTDEAHIAAQLSFNDTNAAALLHSSLHNIDEIVEALVNVIDAIPADGAIPNVPASFPPAKVGKKPDPMRMPRDHVRPTAEQILHTDTGTLGRWLAAVVTDLAVDAKGRAGLTPYTAPAGQQSLRTFFTKPLTEVRKNPTTQIREALTHWRRVNGYTGEYLDHRVLRSAADHPSGKSLEAGVPGATWLAIMALPLLRLTGTGTTVQATLCHPIPGRRQPVITWPLWRQPLHLQAITALVEHPALQPNTTTDPITITTRPWAPLGVFTVAGATRKPVEARKSAGVLAPITITAIP